MTNEINYLDLIAANQEAIRTLAKEVQTLKAIVHENKINLEYDDERYY